MSYTPPSSAPTKDSFWIIVWTVIGSIATVLALIWVIYAYYHPNSGFVSNSPLSSSTINLADVLSQYNSFGTTLEKRNFISNYFGKEVGGLGSFNDIASEGSSYIVVIGVANNYVTCEFDASSGPELLLFTKGQTVDFSGTLQDGVMAGSGDWIISNCSLLN
jgi:hypothetical protein